MATPDATKIGEEHATGEALTLTKAHAAPHELVFHAGWFCPFVQRVWIALEEKQLSYQYKEVNPYKKEAHFLAVNPLGLVPAIEHHNKALYESLVLLEFLDDAYPAKPLFATDPYERARERLAIAFITKSVVPPFYALLQAQEAGDQQAAKGKFVKGLKDFAEQWIVGDEYARGGSFGAVDAAIAPWQVRLFLLEKHRGFTLSETEAKFEQYTKRILATPSVRQTTSELGAYEQAYARYLSNEATSEVAKATRSGDDLP